MIEVVGGVAGYLDDHSLAPLCASMLVNSMVPSCFLRGSSL